MKMLSLRFLASIAVLALVSADMPPGAFAAADSQDKTTNPSPAQAESNDKKASKADKKAAKKAEKGEAESAAAEAAPLSAAEQAAVAAAAERARILKTMSTPFNTASPESKSNENEPSTLSLRPGLPRASLSSRLVPNRVFLPGKIVIGKPAEFVIRGHAGSYAAIAMADKDSGAKPIGPINLRLGPDRKLMAAGTIPASGVLTLIVDMPIQGDLIGLPVYFETVIWQKPDFSDIELAAPLKSESADEIADKANALIVAGEKQQKRGLRFVPESGVPQYQRENAGLDSGRP